MAGEMNISRGLLFNAIFDKLLLVIVGIPAISLLTRFVRQALASLLVRTDAR